MHFEELPGSIPNVQYNENGSINLTKLMHDVINDQERNKIIATHIAVRWKVNIIVLVANLKQAHLIERELRDKSSIEVIKIGEIDDYLNDHPKKLLGKIVFMDFHTFDKIADANIHKHKLFNDYVGLMIAAPHKNIKNIINYLYTNKLKMTLLEIDDCNDLLTTWTDDHCRDFELFKILHHVK